MTDKQQEKKIKKKGPIRFEAIIPVSVIALGTFLYFSYYFDLHLKKLFEYVGTQANGAEVNVGSVHTSFLKGSFDLNVLQVTNKERPNLNSLEIENIHFKYLWDALLRMKFVVEDASINNVQLMKPRKKPGRVLPPEPARPSKLTELQNEVIAQIKNKYSSNMLGDIAAILEGGDYKEQLQNIRADLKSEARVSEMLKDLETKKDFWNQRIKTLSDTGKLKSIEAQVQEISKEKNFLKQVEGVKKLTDLLKQVNDQYKEVQKASQQLQTEVQTVAKYPAELQGLINEDIASVKSRFSVPKIDFKDMAMHLFAGEFAEYIAKARKYQALAKQYIPEKKEEKDEILPPKRTEGKTYAFPITTGYPLFWLKRAAISSTGTKETYAGQVSGELTNVTTSPKQIQKPIVLDMRGDFPAAKILGVKAMVTVDFTKEISRQSALIQVNSFQVPEKLFVKSDKLKFGFQNATGSSTLSASLMDSNIDMKWSSALHKPQFIVDSSSKLAKEMLGNIVNNIPVININGAVTGTFSKFDMSVSSNLGDELSQGFNRELSAKISEAQDKIKAFVDEKINQPKEKLQAMLGGNNVNLSQLGNILELYKKNEDKIKEEIEKLKKGGTSDLKEQGKKLLKGLKF